MIAKKSFFVLSLNSMHLLKLICRADIKYDYAYSSSFMQTLDFCLIFLLFLPTYYSRFSKVVYYQTLCRKSTYYKNLFQNSPQLSPRPLLTFPSYEILDNGSYSFTLMSLRQPLYFILLRLDHMLVHLVVMLLLVIKKEQWFGRMLSSWAVLVPVQSIRGTKLEHWNPTFRKL